jgi:hypothetical protein
MSRSEIPIGQHKGDEDDETDNRNHDRSYRMRRFVAAPFWKIVGAFSSVVHA